MNSVKKTATNENTAIILMHFPDQKGMVAKVTEFINENTGNIIVSS